jgi:hypothetical protein
MRKRGDELTEPTPSAQLLTDLYTALEPHMMKGHMLVLGGDFNRHWEVKTSVGTATFPTLKTWASALGLVHASRHREHKFCTWKHSDSPGADETEPDHVFVSKELADSSAVKLISAFCSGTVNNSDHRPMVLEKLLNAALGLSDAGVRILPPPPKDRVKMLRLSDDKACLRFRDKVVELSRSRALGGRMLELEATLTELKEGWAAGGGEIWDY